MKTSQLENEKDNFIKRKEAINKNTSSSYNTSLNHFFKYLKEANILEINENNVHSILEEFKGYLNKSNFKASSKNNHLKKTETFLRSLNFKVHIAKNNESKSKPKFLESREITLMINETKYCFRNPELALRVKTMIRFLFNTGFRINEALGIKLSNVYERNSEYYVKIHEKGKEENELLEVPIGEKTYNQLMEYVNNKTYPSTYLFSSLKPSEDGTAKQLTKEAVSRNMLRLAKYIDDKYNENLSNVLENNSTHFLRHSRANYLLNDKHYDVIDVKDQLRHSSLNTTMAYLQKKDDHIKNIRITNDI